MILTELTNVQPIELITCENAQSEELIRGALTLMQPEFMSTGGNLRDTDLDSLHQFLSLRGQLWVAHNDKNVMAASTIEAIPGKDRCWYYINNGVVAPDYRRRTSGVMDQLLSTAIAAVGEQEWYVVISVVWGIFERLDFKQVNVEQLYSIDPVIADIVEHKLRHGKNVYIGMRQGGGQ